MKWLFVLVVSFLLLGCTQYQASKSYPSFAASVEPRPTSIATALASTVPSATAFQEPSEGLANPASEFCVNQGFKAELDGSCRFSNGSACEQWDFYRGTCGQNYTDCEKGGGKIDARSETVNEYTGAYAVCVFADGSECSEALYAKGECQAGQCAKWSASDSCTPKSVESQGGEKSALANPASVHCSSLGFKEQLDEDATNCVFSDGSSCEEWAYLRGSCGQKFSACTKTGGNLKAQTESQGGASFAFGLCTFIDGSQCGEGELAAGTCKQGVCKAWGYDGCKD